MAYNGSTIMLLYVAITSGSILLTYFLSIVFRHANSFFPYLSHLGDKPMESTVFTQCFVVDAAALIVVVQIRFVQAFRCLTMRESPEKVFRVNRMGACAGHVAAVGLFVLSCFQESNAYFVHQIGGVFPYFFGSLVYFTAQSIVSAHLASTSRDRLFLRMRIAFNCLMVFFFLLFEIGYLISFQQFQRPWEDRATWTNDDGGWFFHVASVWSEWMLLLLHNLYFLTFYHDLKGVFLTKNRILVANSG